MRRRVLMNDQRGFTLVEVTMAAFLLIVGMLSVLGLVNGANKRITENRAREGATNLAREVAEGARAVSYPDVDASTISTYIQDQPGLADTGAAAGWQVERRGVTYTIEVSTCVMDDDDPQDGVGDHTGLGTFCSDSPTAVTTPADLNPDDYKRVSVKISYLRKLKTFDVRQTAIINNPGSAFAPTVRTLAPTGLTAPYKVTNPGTTSLNFSALVTPRAKYVQWFVDNVKQGTASGTNDTWTFTWNFGAGLSDGVYLIGAQGFNAADQSGADKTISVTLNRYAPTRPAAFLAGRNTTVGVEFDWVPSPDRDVSAYRVYRLASLTATPSASDQLMCTKPVSDKEPTSCNVSNVSGDQRYYVVAVAPARSGSGVEESARPTNAQTVLVTANVAPNPPTGFTASRTDDIVTMTWSMPTAPAGGEAGDSVAFYRIYRDGKQVADRYGRIDPVALIFQDDKTGGLTHKYWITAVDTHLQESSFVGPVEL